MLPSVLSLATDQRASAIDGMRSKVTNNIIQGSKGENYNHEV